MSLIRGAMGMGRSVARSRYTETLDAFTESRTLDEETGLHVDTEVIIHGPVAGRVKFPTLTVSEREQGAQVPAAQDVEVHVDVGATPNVAVNVMWRITASTADGSLVGRTFRTKGMPQAGQVTAHRYPVEAVS